MNGKTIGVLQLFLLMTLLSSCHLFYPPEQNNVARRIVFAEVVALDQPITYNRFGSYNPYGMMYALKRDVVDTERCDLNVPEGKENCRAMSADTRPGHVRLRKGKRPRPLVLRASSGDRLEIRFYNMLMPNQPDTSSPETPLPDTSLRLTFSDIGKPETEAPVLLAGEAEAHPAEIEGEAAIKGCGSEIGGEKPGSSNWPRTRCASITISGVTPAGDAHDPLRTGLQPIPPGAVVDYAWNIQLSEAQRKRKSTHLFFSHGAPAGGEGDGGSLVHGLFGVLNIEPVGSKWYRSQVDQKAFRLAREQKQGNAWLNYAARYPDGTPVLEMLRPVSGNRYELIYGDLNAIIVESDPPKDVETPAFREFTVVFHDELKTFYADQFKELETEFTLSGVGDGFAINYGASGMGTLLLANRKKIGPAKDCANCAYEEFFLESWVNGDPALLPGFADDPSNVHHSYLNDRVEFRNLHAGPKETHVFHLHAHQWLSQQSDTGTYLDSQTIAPQQGFSYPIYYGGSGNRNKTPGDSIFHCHLYPHFAQGMWALWRVHDVLEDGTRRLPDGELGPGTDVVTGITPTDSGTPIPAIVPLPQQAMPPEPTYVATAGKDAFPGYPFYIAGVPGQRAPQAPLDIANDAGLGRHVLLGGSRGVSGLSAAEAEAVSPDELVAHALRTGDFTSHIETARIRLLPHDGTPLEKRAMMFHAAGKHASLTPEGMPEDFIVNDKPPKPGAPFADPCTGDAWRYSKQYTREYRVSAIQTDLVVNHAGWHDPQARINVLDSDVARFENKTTDEAEPFFFRANSGDCINFRHTNRTPYELDLDDFQVRTPTDTIGQHIHLVKFDVTASDGSGNGFNYEDGTFAKEEINHLIDASKRPGGEAVDIHGQPVALQKTPDDDFQTTVQRWYADPLLTTEQACFDALAAIADDDPGAAEKRRQIWASDACRDRTIRTVFTHDHFAPSSIQQHGFYAALLVEPRESRFLERDGTEMPEQAVGAEAMIVHLGDDGAKEDYREFALAVADFALLYDGHGRPDVKAEGFRQAADNLQDQLDAANAAGDAELAEKISGELEKRRAVLPELDAHFAAIHARHGKPVDPPKLPEAISKDHHNPYLVNYRHEPLPLRIGCNGLDAADPGGKCAADSVRQQRNDSKGEMANVFSSRHHGDPATPVLAGYEGEKVQLRLIQGAQEVQHSFHIHGQSWSREAARDRNDENAVLVSAQEVGISEHFEMQLGLDTILRGDLFTDYLYHFGSVDDIWNGAWGLIRSVSTGNLDQCSQPGNQEKCAALKALCEDTEGIVGQDWLANCLSPLAAHKNGGAPVTRLKVKNIDAFRGAGDYTCPADAPVVHYSVAAVDVGEWLGSELRYREHIIDPDGLAFVALERFSPADVEAGKAEGYLAHPAGARGYALQKLDALKSYYQHHSLEPLVLRANAGQCVRVALFNLLPANMADAPGDALMPKIVPLNVDQAAGVDGHGQTAGDVTPSSRVSLHVQKLFYTVDENDGTNAGWNTAVLSSPLAAPLSECAPNDPVCGPQHYHWYAGTVSLEPCAEDPGQKCLVARPKELGASNLTSLGDVINHPVHGLYGALIVEPAQAEYECLDASGKVDAERQALHIGCGIRSRIKSPEGSFREFVVFYRDGLNLHYTSGESSHPIPDCLICDDSYDLGEKGINYNTEPFWARLQQKPVLDSVSGAWTLPELNAAFFPENFFLESWQPVATPGFVAREGEEVRFRVLQPSGRARQRAFLVYGHDFVDMMPEFGSPHAPIITVGKAITAKIDAANPGLWQYRDGPNQIWAGGAWGLFEVTPDP